MSRYLCVIWVLFLLMCTLAVASDANKPSISSPTANDNNSFDIAKLKKSAEAGDANSQVELGKYYFGEKNYKDAVKWSRKAAEQGNARGQNNLGACYAGGQGVNQDYREAVKWYRKAANQRFAQAQNNLGACYYNGQGVQRDYREAMKWFRKAAEQGIADAQYGLGLCYQWSKNVGDKKEAVKWYQCAAEQGVANAQYNLGGCYYEGRGVEQNYKAAVEWWKKAADQGIADAQYNLSICYENGQGVIEDNVEAYKWLILAGANGKDISKVKTIDVRKLTQRQLAEAQRRAKEFVAKKESAENTDMPFAMPSMADVPKGTGTGFFVDKAGYIVTAHHVIGGARLVKVKTSAGLLLAKVLFGDDATDIAILKVDGNDFSSLSLAVSSAVKTGDKICTIGYPNIRMQGQEAKYTEGVISSLSGPGNNPRYFQISTAVQPGNSGGPLVNDAGQVVGVVTARLSDAAAIEETGAIPQNVNYAVKSAFVMPFIENIPEIKQAGKAAYKDRAEIIEQMKKATVLVVCY